MVNYKVCAKKGSSYTFYGEVEYLMKDYWTTIQFEEEQSEGLVKYFAKANLMKQVAKDILGSVRGWKRIYLDNSDLEIVKA